MPKLSDFTEVAKEYGSRGSEWFNPPMGESKIRILSEEFAVLAKHYIPSLKRSFVCYGKDEGCPHDSTIKDKNTGETKVVHKPGVKYLWWVIDRKDGKVKIAELPYSVCQPIADLKNSDEYGFESAPNYDIIITKKKTGPAATDVEYSVVPSRKDTPLTEEEKATFSEKPSLEEIVEKMKSKEKEKSKSTNLTDALAPGNEDTEVE